MTILHVFCLLCAITLSWTCSPLYKNTPEATFIGCTNDPNKYLLSLTDWHENKPINQVDATFDINTGSLHKTSKESAVACSVLPTPSVHPYTIIAECTVRGLTWVVKREQGIIGQFEYNDGSSTYDLRLFAYDPDHGYFIVQLETPTGPVTLRVQSTTFNVTHMDVTSFKIPDAPLVLSDHCQAYAIASNGVCTWKYENIPCSDSTETYVYPEIDLLEVITSREYICSDKELAYYYYNASNGVIKPIFSGPSPMTSFATVGQEHHSLRIEHPSTVIVHSWPPLKDSTFDLTDLMRKELQLSSTRMILLIAIMSVFGLLIIAAAIAGVVYMVYKHKKTDEGYRGDSILALDGENVELE